MYKAWTQSGLSRYFFGSEVCRWEHSSKNKGWPGHPWGRSFLGAHQWAKSSPAGRLRERVGAPGFVPLDTGSECKPSTPPAHMCSVAPMLKCGKDLVSSENLLNAWQHDRECAGRQSPNRTVCFSLVQACCVRMVCLSCPRPPPFFVLCDLPLHSPLYPARGRLRPVACWASKRCLRAWQAILGTLFNLGTVFWVAHVDVPASVG